MARFLNYAFTYGLGYAFACPDLKPAMQNMPSFTQKNFVYMTKFYVEEENQPDFLWHWKNFARYCQQEPGYVNTHLLKAKDPVTSPFQFIGFTTWLTATDQRAAMSKPMAEQLIKRMIIYDKTGEYKSSLFKVLVDDSDYVPLPI